MLHDETTLPIPDRITNFALVHNMEAGHPNLFDRGNNLPEMNSHLREHNEIS